MPEILWLSALLCTVLATAGYVSTVVVYHEYRNTKNVLYWILASSFIVCFLQLLL